MQNISLSDISSVIRKLTARGARPITLHIETEPKLNAAGKFIFRHGITKQSVVNGMLNANYESSVNRQLSREEKDESFVVSSNWFIHTQTSGIVANKKDASKLYLQIKLEKAISSKYVDAMGAEYSADQMERYLAARSMPSNQGTDKPILTFTVALANIKSFTCDGETYQIGNEGTHHTPTNRGLLDNLTLGSQAVMLTR